MPSEILVTNFESCGRSCFLKFSHFNRRARRRARYRLSRTGFITSYLMAGMRGAKPILCHNGLGLAGDFTRIRSLHACSGAQLEPKRMREREVVQVYRRARI
jgi:hypothetical protein